MGERASRKSASETSKKKKVLLLSGSLEEEGAAAIRPSWARSKKKALLLSMQQHLLCARFALAPHAPVPELRDALSDPPLFLVVFLLAFARRDHVVFDFHLELSELPDDKDGEHESEEVLGVGVRRERSEGESGSSGGSSFEEQKTSLSVAPTLSNTCTLYRAASTSSNPFVSCSTISLGRLPNVTNATIQLRACRVPRITRPASMFLSATMSRNVRCRVVMAVEKCSTCERRERERERERVSGACA
jgi:hypothetical protein